MIKAKISIIITTYNWPEALKASLLALNQQEDTDFEIVVADDGSEDKTRKLIQTLKPIMKMPLHHVWQEDKGFRAAAIRNQAILKASGEYIIFLDGDCIPKLNFVGMHRFLAEKGYFVVGNRILLSEKFTQQVLAKNIPIQLWSWFDWLLARLQGHCNRIFSFIPFPLGGIRKISPKRWQGAKGCNLAAWKSDLISVNGFEEKFTGWGYEDSDLVIRLISAKVKRKEGRFYLPVIHLWHKENDRSKKSENWELLQLRIQTGQICSEQGLNQY